MKKIFSSSVKREIGKSKSVVLRSGELLPCAIIE